MNNEKTSMEQVSRLSRQLRMPGLYEEIAALSEDPEAQQCAPIQWVLQGLQQEQLRRSSNGLMKRLKQANLRYPEANEGNVNYDAGRGLKRSQIRSLMECEWIRQQQNCIIVGKVGVGKTWLACALGNAACRANLSVLMLRVHELIQLIGQSISRGEDPLWQLRHLLHVDLLILDDWGLGQLSAPVKGVLLELIEKRYQNKSNLITSMFPISKWAAWIDDVSYADAILDRIVPLAHKVMIDGESLRGKPENGAVTPEDAKDQSVVTVSRRSQFFSPYEQRKLTVREAVSMIMQSCYDQKKGFPSMQRLYEMIGKGSFGTITAARKQWLIDHNLWDPWLAGEIKVQS